MPMAVPTRSAGIGGGCSGDCPSPACPPALSPPRRRDEAALLACRPPPRGLESGGREGAACTLRRGGDSPEEETSSEASPASAWREELTCRHSDSRLCSWAPIVRSSPSDEGAPRRGRAPPLQGGASPLRGVVRAAAAGAVPCLRHEGQRPRAASAAARYSAAAAGASGRPCLCNCDERMISGRNGL